MYKNKSRRWTSSEMLSFRDLKYADNKMIALLSEKKEMLINTPIEKAVEQGIVDENSKTAVFGYIYLRRMALVFDAFMALADD